MPQHHYILIKGAKGTGIPIGGLTPMGYRKVSEGVYVKEGEQSGKVGRLSNTHNDALVYLLEGGDASTVPVDLRADLVDRGLFSKWKLTLEGEKRAKAYQTSQRARKADHHGYQLLRDAANVSVPELQAMLRNQERRHAESHGTDAKRAADAHKRTRAMKVLLELAKVKAGIDAQDLGPFQKRQRIAAAEEYAAKQLQAVPRAKYAAPPEVAPAAEPQVTRFTLGPEPAEVKPVSLEDLKERHSLEMQAAIRGKASTGELTALAQKHMDAERAHPESMEPSKVAAERLADIQRQGFMRGRKGTPTPELPAIPDQEKKASESAPGWERMPEAERRSLVHRAVVSRVLAEKREASIQEMVSGGYRLGDEAYQDLKSKKAVAEKAMAELEAATGGGDKLAEVLTEGMERNHRERGELQRKIEVLEGYLEETPQGRDARRYRDSIKQHKSALDLLGGRLTAEQLGTVPAPTEPAAKPADPKPVAPEAKTYKASRGQGYGGTDLKPGTIVRAADYRIDAGGETHLAVVQTTRRYYRDEGMSFGVGDERGYVYSYTFRPLTDSEKGEQAARDALRNKAAMAVKALGDAAARVQKEGVYPTGITWPGGVEFYYSGKENRIYGGGRSFQIDGDRVWHFQGNGADGDDFGLNNLPGTIAHYVDDPELARHLLDHARTLGLELEEHEEQDAPYVPGWERMPEDARQYKVRGSAALEGAPEGTILMTEKGQWAVKRSSGWQAWDQYGRAAGELRPEVLDEKAVRVFSQVRSRGMNEYSETPGGPIVIGAVFIHSGALGKLVPHPTEGWAKPIIDWGKDRYTELEPDPQVHAPHLEFPGAERALIGLPRGELASALLAHNRAKNWLLPRAEDPVKSKEERDFLKAQAGWHAAQVKLLEEQLGGKLTGAQLEETVRREAEGEPLLVLPEKAGPQVDPATKRPTIHSEQFKGWFGDWTVGEGSKVVKPSGEPQEQHNITPITVYHGTAVGGFRSFDPAKVKPGIFGRGFYFTEDQEIAVSYTAKGSEDAWQRVLYFEREGKRVDRMPKDLFLGMFTDWEKSSEYVAKNKYKELSEWVESSLAGDDVDLPKLLDNIRAKLYTGMMTGAVISRVEDTLGVEGVIPPSTVFEVYLNIRNPIDMDTPMPREMFQRYATATIERRLRLMDETLAKNATSIAMAEQQLQEKIERFDKWKQTDNAFEKERAEQDVTYAKADLASHQELRESYEETVKEMRGLLGQDERPVVDLYMDDLLGGDRHKFATGKDYADPHTYDDFLKLKKAMRGHTNDSGSWAHPILQLSPVDQLTWGDFHWMMTNRNKETLSGDDRFLEWARGQGFDGIAHTGGWNIGVKPHRVWIAFEPAQVKATDARRFDPTSEDMWNGDEPPEPGAAVVGGQVVGEQEQVAAELKPEPEQPALVVPGEKLAAKPEPESRFRVRHHSGGLGTGAPRQFAVEKYDPQPGKMPWQVVAAGFPNYDAAVTARSRIEADFREPEPEPPAPKPSLTWRELAESKLEALPEGLGLVKVSMDDIPWETAAGAYAGTSHDPDSRGARQRWDYARHILAVEEDLARLAKTPEQQEKLKAELESYRRIYRQKLLAYLGSHGRVVSSFIAGASNFPAAQMEKRSNYAHKHLVELLEWSKKARNRMRRDLAGGGPITAADPDAVAKLQKQIEQAEQLQATMKAANAIVRKKGLTEEQKVAQLVGLEGISETTARELLKPDFAGRLGFPDFKLTNNNANIKRLKARVQDVSQLQAKPTRELAFEGGTVTDNAEDNRVQIFFDAKPDDATRGKLKARGFRWAPSVGAWQRQRTATALQAVRDVLGVSLTTTSPEPAPDTTDSAAIVATQPKEEIEAGPIPGETAPALVPGPAPVPAIRPLFTQPPTPTVPVARTEVERPVIGGQVQTASGRMIPAPPRIWMDSPRKTTKDVAAVEAWLHAQGLAEAEARRDDYVAGLFRGLKPKNLSPGDKDSLNDYLFGETDPVFRAETPKAEQPVLVLPAASKGSGGVDKPELTPEEAKAGAEQFRENVAQRDITKPEEYRRLMAEGDKLKAGRIADQKKWYAKLATKGWYMNEQGGGRIVLGRGSPTKPGRVLMQRHDDGSWTVTGESPEFPETTFPDLDAARAGVLEHVKTVGPSPAVRVSVPDGTKAYDPNLGPSKPGWHRMPEEDAEIKQAAETWLPPAPMYASKQETATGRRTREQTALDNEWSTQVRRFAKTMKYAGMSMQLGRVGDLLRGLYQGDTLLRYGKGSDRKPMSAGELDALRRSLVGIMVKLHNLYKEPEHGMGKSLAVADLDISTWLAQNAPI